MHVIPAAPVRPSRMAPVATGLVVAGRLVAQQVRPMTALLIGLQGVFCYALISHRAPAPVGVLFALVALASWYAQATTINDLSDIVTDRINLRADDHAAERPLVNGTATPRHLRVFAIVLAPVIMIASVVVSPWLLFASAGMIALNLVYSVRPVRLAGRGGIAQAVLPLGYVVVPAVYAWALAGFAPITPTAVVAVIGLYVLFAGRLMLKDLRDVRGDRAVGKFTFLVRHGHRTTLVVSAVLVLAGMMIMAVSVAAIVTRPGPTVLLAALGAVAAVAVVVALRRIATEVEIARQVLLVGVVGRCATGWLFGTLLVELAPATMPLWQLVVLVGLAAGMFAAGCLMIIERVRTG